MKVREKFNYAQFNLLLNVFSGLYKTLLIGFIHSAYDISFSNLYVYIVVYTM